MIRRWLGKNWFALVIGLIVLGGFVTLYNNWLAFSAFAMLLLALAAFWTIWDNRQTRREERKREHTARSADELCAWAEGALRLYYLPYNYHKDEIKDGLSNLMVKNMVMVIAATIIGDEFIEPTKRAEEALAKYYEVIRDRYYKRVSKLAKETALAAEFEDAFYSLLSYLYVLRYRDYDYHRFLDDAIENGKLKSKYQLRDGGDIGSLDKQEEKNSMLRSDLNNQEPLSFRPLPWGVLFFSFWITLRMVDDPTLLIKGTAWFFLILSGILLLSVFTKPLFPLLQRTINRRIPRFNRILTSQNVNGFFVSLVFFVTLIGFPTYIIMSWSKLQGIDLSISVIGLVLWLIAYILVLVSIASQIGKAGQVIGGVISALIIWSAKNAFTSDVLAGWILITIGVISIVIVIKKPKSWDLWQMV